MDNREAMPRGLDIADQEDEGDMLVKIDEIRVEGAQEDHRILALILQGERVADQAVSDNKTLGVEKDEEKKEFSPECMEIGDREGANDTENLELQFTQISDRPSLRELDVNEST